MSLKNNFSSVWAEIDLGALKNNLRVIRKSLSPSVETLAIVKAEAYGHGMLPVAQTLWKEGVQFFGVANIEEALLLRRALPKARILTLGSFHPSQIDSYIENKIIPTLSCSEDAFLLNQKLRKGALFPVHLKIDTGMGRLGLPHREMEKFLQKLKSWPSLDLEGVYTHFSSADDESVKPTHRQLEIFSNGVEAIRAAGFCPRYIHASNSMGVLRFKEAHFNLVRPGILLYGLKPSASAKLPAGIRPILSWKTRISFLKNFSPGQTVSYGRTHQIKKNTLIATLPVGYSHGYRVAFSNRSFVLIKGFACPVVGRVTMDQILVDVGRARGVKRWDEAVLIGSQKNKKILAEELAVLAGTIPYEIVCAIHSRVPRIFKGKEFYETE